MRNARLAAWLILALAAFFDIGSSSAAPTPRQELETMRGTIDAVDLDAQQIRLITGVGLALRTMEFHTGSECRIERGGVEARLADLKRGEIVSVRYRKTAERYEAEVIETGTAADERRGEPR